MAFSIGGQDYQHALIDLQAVATGAPYSFARFKSIKYKASAKKKPVTDSQGQQVSYTIDKQETDGSVQMLLAEWWKWRDWLRLQAQQASAQNAGRKVGIGQVAFDVTIKYGATLATYKTDKLLGAMVQEEPRDSSDNQEVLMVEIPLFILDIQDDANNRFVEYR